MRKGRNGEKKWNGKNRKQAGAELGQAQLKLGLDFNSINFNQTSIIVLVE